MAIFRTLGNTNEVLAGVVTGALGALAGVQAVSARAAAMVMGARAERMRMMWSFVCFLLMY
jgi:hypothetical protein